MTTDKKYLSRDNLPQPGDIVQWGECDPGEHHLLVIGEPYLTTETSIEVHNYARQKEGYWEFECIDLNSNSKTVNWFEDEIVSGYRFISRL